MKIQMWKDGRLQYVDISDKYIYVATCGSGTTVFAEEVEFVKYTTQHLVWKRKNGKTFKTNDQGWGVGKAQHAFILVKDEPIQFCDPHQGIRTDYIKGVYDF